MNKFNVCLALCVLTSLSSFADEGELGRWTFFAGPAWRSRVKIETSGRIAAPTPAADRTVRSLDMNNPANWEAEGPAVKVADPLAGVPGSGVPAGGQLWQVSSMRTEYTGVAGRDYAVGASGEDAPLGLTLSAGYDFYRGETFAVGLNLRFAGYWNMKSETRGNYNAGHTQIDYYSDHSIFTGCPVLGTFGEDVSPDYDRPEANGWTQVYPDGLPTEEDYGSRAVSTRLRSDLYQIGLGPKVTWSPFVGWCDCMSWLDVYGGVEVLCNLAHTEFDADGRSSSQTDCLLGFGGNVGLVGNITENIGIYGQVGYEWIDDTDVSTRGFKADVDYSSFVLSMGLKFRF